MYTTIEPLGYTYIANRMLYVNCTSIKKNLFIEKNSWVLANSRQNSWFSIGKEAVSRCFIQEKKKYNLMDFSSKLGLEFTFTLTS